MATEKACVKFPENEADQLHSEVAGLLKKATPTPECHQRGKTGPTGVGQRYVDYGVTCR